jgi:hypothetical protein
MTDLASFFFPNGIPENIKDYGIIMPIHIRTELVEMQDQIGNNRHRVSPVELVDGNFAINADVLTETNQGGLWSNISWITEEQLSECSLVPWNDVLELLPKPDLEEFE